MGWTIGFANGGPPVGRPTDEDVRRPSPEQCTHLDKARRREWRVGLAVVIAATFGALLVYEAHHALEVYCFHHDGLRLCRDPTYPWSTLVTFAAVPSLLLTWYWRATQKNRDIANVTDSNTTSAASLATARFEAAVKMLDESRSSVLGGIHALKELGRTTPDYRRLALEVLADFVRLTSFQFPETSSKRLEHHTLTLHVRVALQALSELLALSGSLPPAGDARPEPGSLRQVNLSRVDLSDTNLSRLDLRLVVLRQTKLIGATLADANLSGANLDGAQLTEAKVIRTQLEGTLLQNANLVGCRLSDSNLTGALLSANLTGARLENVNCHAANLLFADLSGATLKNVDFSAATLDFARCAGTNIAGVVHDESTTGWDETLGKLVP